LKSSYNLGRVHNFFEEKMKQTNKEKIMSVPMDQQTADKIEALATSMDVSKAHIVRAALKAWLSVAPEPEVVIPGKGFKGGHHP
jgi:hypothetical protein